MSVSESIDLAYAQNDGHVIYDEKKKKNMGREVI